MSALGWAAVEDAIQAWMVAGSGLAADHVIWTQQTAPRPTGEYIAMRLSGPMGVGRDWIDRYDNVIVVGTLTISAVNATADTLTITGHGLVTGDGPLQPATTGTVPGGLTAGGSYWAVVVDPNTIKLAATFPNAVAASPVVVDLTSAGTGTNTIGGTPTTVRAGAELIAYLRGPRTAELELQCFAGAPTGGAATGTTSPVAILNDAITSRGLDSRRAALAAAGVAVLSVERVRSIDGVVNTTRFEPRAIATVHLSLASELFETSSYIQTVNATNQIVTPNTTVTASSP